MLSMVVTVALVSFLALAAWRDVVIRTIPDTAVLLMASIGIAIRATTGLTPLLLSVATAALLFIVLLALAMRDWLGGGDVKLAAALALGLPPADTWYFLVATVLAGGVLGLGYLAGPRFAPRLRPAGAAHPFARVLAVEARRIRRGGPLPYGVAIAIGGTLVLLKGA